MSLNSTAHTAGSHLHAQVSMGTCACVRGLQFMFWLSHLVLVSVFFVWVALSMVQSVFALSLNIPVPQRPYRMSSWFSFRDFCRTARPHYTVGARKLEQGHPHSPEPRQEGNQQNSGYIRVETLWSLLWRYLEVGESNNILLGGCRLLVRLKYRSPEALTGDNRP